MNLDQHALDLGKLLGNLQSLEFALRAFLSNLPGSKVSSLPSGVDLYESPVGTELAETELTNYDSLGVLISKFNTLMNARGEPEVDRTLVDLRDALAHGRISAPESLDQLRIIKFSKPQAGKVKVEFNEIMSPEWLAQQRGRVRASILLVHTATGA